MGKKRVQVNTRSWFQLKLQNNNVITKLLGITAGNGARLFDGGREQVVDAALRLLVRDLKEQFGVPDPIGSEPTSIADLPETVAMSPGDAGMPSVIPTPMVPEVPATPVEVATSETTTEEAAGTADVKPS